MTDNEKIELARSLQLLLQTMKDSFDSGSLGKNNPELEPVWKMGGEGHLAAVNNYLADVDAGKGAEPNMHVQRLFKAFLQPISPELRELIETEKKKNEKKP